MRGRFAPIWSLVVIALLAHAWAAAHGEGLRPPIEAESHLEHLVPSDATFVIDFTWSEARGLKVLEFGGSHTGGSSFRGHVHAFPGGPFVDELYEQARQDYLRRSGRTPIPYEPLAWLWPWHKPRPQKGGEGQAIVQPPPGRPYSRRLRSLYPNAAFLGSQTLNETLMHKGRSQILYGHPAPSVQPETYVTDLVAPLKSESNQERVQRIASLPTDDVVVKPVNGVLSRGVEILPKAKLLSAVERSRGWEALKQEPEGPVVIQPYYPSDLVATRKGLYSPTGRIYFHSHFDGKKLWLYPLTLYWKMHERPYPKTTRALTSANARVTRMAFGAPIDPELEERIIGAVTPFALDVVRRLAEISQKGLAGDSPIAESLRAAYRTLPEPHGRRQIEGSLRDSYYQWQLNCRLSDLAN